jgi:O-antigen/teichoic acid export membrane protein
VKVVAAIRRLARSAADGPWRFYLGYALGRGAGLLALPVVAHIIGPAGIGRLEVATAILSAASIVLDAGIAAAVVRYLRDPRWDERTVTVSAFRLQLAVATLTMVLCAPVMLAVGPNDEPIVALVAIVVAYAYIEGFAILGGGLLRAAQSDGTYLSLSVVRLVMTVAVAVAGAEVAGATGALTGMAVGGAAFAVYALRVRMRIGHARARRDVLVLMARYGLPLIAMTACSWTLALSDRLFLQAAVSPDKLGNYSANYRMGSLVLTFMVAPLMLGWLPRALALSPEARVAAQRRLTLAFSGVSIGAGICLCALSPFAIPLLFGDGFDGSPAVVGVIALVGWLGGLYHLILTPLLVSDSTRRVSVVALAATAVNLLANAILIPTLGTTGALIATLASYLVLVWFARLAVRGFPANPVTPAAVAVDVYVGRHP